MASIFSVSGWTPPNRGSGRGWGAPLSEIGSIAALVIIGGSSWRELWVRPAATGRQPH